MGLGDDSRGAEGDGVEGEGRLATDSEYPWPWPWPRLGLCGARCEYISGRRRMAAEDAEDAMDAEIDITDGDTAADTQPAPPWTLGEVTVIPAASAGGSLSPGVLAPPAAAAAAAADCAVSSAGEGLQGGDSSSGESMGGR
jgi:hypothetical protein